MKHSLSVLSLLLSVLLVLFLVPAGYAENTEETWAVYIFLCGSNLESDNGNATYNLNELGEYCYALPDNVTFVVEAGGASEWHTPFLHPARQNRFTVDNNGFQMVEQLPAADMTDPETLENFLTFATARYPADKTMLILWDHGGGTCNGINIDQNFPESSMMSITQLHDALTSALGSDNQNPPLDILMFDACLMATEDVMDLFSDCASYLVASEETIPADGTSYGGMCLSFIDDPAIAPEQFGREILDYYVKKCEDLGTADGITLSLMDLSKADAVASALDEFGGELLKSVYGDPQVYLDLAMDAGDTINYYINSRLANEYWNLIDLGSFAEKYAEKYPSAADLVKAIDDCVVYNVNGYYKTGSKGISFYYSYNADEVQLELFEREGTSQALKALYSISVNGSIYEQEREFVTSLGLDPDNTPMVNTFDELDELCPPVTKNENGLYEVDFGTDAGRYVTNVLYQLYFISPSTGAYYYIGTEDYGLKTDFSNGKFTLNPDGMEWIQIGEWLAVKDLALDSEKTNIYYIPIMYDGDTCYIQLAKDNQTGELSNIGACGQDANPGEASAFDLEEGEDISIVLYSADSDEMVAVETVEYSDDLLKICNLEDGDYAFRFTLEDIHKDVIFSDLACFTVKNGKIV